MLQVMLLIIFTAVNDYLGHGSEKWLAKTGCMGNQTHFSHTRSEIDRLLFSLLNSRKMFQERMLARQATGGTVTTMDRRIGRKRVRTVFGKYVFVLCLSYSPATVHCGKSATLLISWIAALLSSSSWHIFLLIAPSGCGEPRFRIALAWSHRHLDLGKSPCSRGSKHQLNFFRILAWAATVEVENTRA